MNKKMHSRNYQALIYTKDRDVLSKLNDTYNLFLKGSSVWANFWLDFLGGFELPFWKESPLNTIECVTSFEDSDDGEKQVSESVNPLAMAFSCWFSLESVDYAPKDYIINTDKVLDKFNIYTSEQLPEDWKKVLELTVSQINKKEAVWVDRRASFFNRKVIIPFEARRSLFCNKEFPFQASSKDSVKYLRDGDRVVLSISDTSWDSDVNASCNIALRGLKTLLWPQDRRPVKKRKNDTKSFSTKKRRWPGTNAKKKNGEPQTNGV